VQARRGGHGWWGSLAPALAVLDPAAVVLAALLVVPDVGWGPVVLGAEGAFLVTLVTGRQRSRLVLSVVADLPVLGLAAATAAAAIVMASDVLSLDGRGGRELALALVVLAALVLVRVVAYPMARLLRRSGRTSTEAVLVGSGDTGRLVAGTLEERPGLGLVPVGFVDCDKGLSARGLPLPFLGHLELLPELLDEYDAAAVIFCFDAMPDDRCEDVVRDCLARRERVFVTDGFWRSRAERGRSEKVGDIGLTQLHGWPGGRRRPRGSSASAARADQPQVRAGQLAS